MQRKGDGMKPDDLTTEEAIAVFSLTEKYIKTLKWSKDSDDYIKTVVIGNVRGFFMWLYKNDFIKPFDKRGYDEEIGVDK
jgi:hypothetical protein